MVIQSFYKFPIAYYLYSSSAQVEPAVPSVIPLLLNFSLASSTEVGGCDVSVFSLLTAVGSCSLILAGDIGSFDSYSLLITLYLFCIVFHFSLVCSEVPTALSLTSFSVLSYILLIIYLTFYEY